MPKIKQFKVGDLARLSDECALDRYLFGDIEILPGATGVIIRRTKAGAYYKVAWATKVGIRKAVMEDVELMLVREMP